MAAKIPIITGTGIRIFFVNRDAQEIALQLFDSAHSPPKSDPLLGLLEYASVLRLLNIHMLPSPRMLDVML